MAEVGLVGFGRVALDVARAVVPAYRSRFSKHQFTQPQLLAVLCLMRFEDWTYREAEVRLAEHRELQRALKLRSVPDHTTLSRFLRRLDEGVLTRALAEVAQRLPPPRRGRATVAVDATGLASGAVSTYFVRRLRDFGQEHSRRYWLKWLLVVDVERRAIVAQTAHRGPCNDSATLRPLVDAARAVVPVRAVLADGEFDSEQNHRHVRRRLGAASVIPAVRGKRSWRPQGVRAQMRASFPRRLYAQRALIESVVSAVKRKLSARAPGRSLLTQRLQALLLGIAYDLYRLPSSPTP
jgi:DDE family transposase/transposase-like protein DUF772